MVSLIKGVETILKIFFLGMLLLLDEVNAENDSGNIIVLAGYNELASNFIFVMNGPFRQMELVCWSLFHMMKMCYCRIQTQQ